MSAGLLQRRRGSLPVSPGSVGVDGGTPFSVSESQTISISYQEHQDQEGCQTRH